MRLVRHNNLECAMTNEKWVVNFYDHKPLSFSSKEDLEKYLNGDWSDEHGFMEYERVPSDVEYIIYYDIDWDEDI